MTEKICKKCGNYQLDGKFCEKCGTQLYPDKGFTEWNIKDRENLKICLNPTFNRWTGQRIRKWLIFRLRKQYLDDIIAGKKDVEYRRDSVFWKGRVEYVMETKIDHIDHSFIKIPKESFAKPVYAVLVSGPRIHRKEIVFIERIKAPSWFSDQGKKDVDTPLCWAFHLGKE